MFEDSLIESGGRLKTSRPATAAFSFGLQAVIVGIMVLIPLLFTEALPKAQLMMALVAPPPPPPPPPPPVAVKVVKQVQTDIINNQLRTPTKIPKKVEMIKEEEAPPPSMGVVGGVPGGVPGGSMGGVMGSIIGGTPTAVPKVAVQRIRVSQGVVAGLVIRKVQPNYPQLAKTARVQGNVQLAALIGKDGTIQNLHVLSGHPLLTQAALDAVKQWRYKPYILNGEPVEVDTQITVIFSLSGS
ncbi:MAG TPA: energy transducer TonB [Terriglobales bacterium]|nr:energy transducer TonB [Terriglobales bacterium]